VSLFELEVVGGPWSKRLARRRAGFDDLPWGEPARAPAEAREAAQRVWTLSAFSEVASAAAFAEIAGCLLAAGAPLDLSAAAGDFVVDEVLHAELCARVAMAMGGAVPLEVDLSRLVRPPEAPAPLLRAAELVVRTSCVGEALTVPILRATRKASRSPLVRAVIARIVKDESQHAEIGPWFLDWAAPRLSNEERAHLGRVAGHALSSFTPIFLGACAAGDDLGVLDCARYDPVFADAVVRRVAEPLGERGIVVPAEDVRAVVEAAVGRPPS
jgi:hypothetical protein